MTAPNSNENLDAYFSSAGSWADDRLSAIRKSRKIAWIIAMVAVVVALAEAVALMVLAPLKTVVPYTLLVDRQTGYVQSLDPIAPQHIAPDAALTQSFLVQYVLAREGFDIGTVKSDYRKISLWSADAAQREYIAAMQISNPVSPLARLPRSTIVQARVRSVSSVSPGTALVRFETLRIDQGGAEQPSQSWVALISYRYSNAPMAVEDRYTNPLGFQVTRYRKNAETLPLPLPLPDSADTIPAPPQGRHPIAPTRQVGPVEAVPATSQANQAKRDAK
jgi:type IV secretion system protein VirB8